MTEIEQIKKELAENHFGPCDINPEGMSVDKFNFYAYARQRFSSLITTIESQKEEIQIQKNVADRERHYASTLETDLSNQKGIIDGLANDRHDLINEVDTLKDKLFDQKAITELAVECLKEISDGGSTGEDARDMRISADFTLAKIKELQNGTT